MKVRDQETKQSSYGYGQKMNYLVNVVVVS